MSLGEGKHSFLSYDLRTAKGEAQFGNNQIQVSSFLAPVTQPGIDKTEVQKRQEAESLDFSNVLLSYPFWAPVISEGNSIEYEHKSDHMRISSISIVSLLTLIQVTRGMGGKGERLLQDSVLLD